MMLAQNGMKLYLFENISIMDTTVAAADRKS